MSWTDTMVAALPRGFQWPSELVALFRWIEAHGDVDGVVGRLVAPAHQTRQFDEATETLTGTGGTIIRFFPSDPELPGPAGNTFGDLPADRVFVFGKTGADGSNLGLFREDDGRCRIVHLGSGSGSTWYGGIGDTPVDFLRLLAIGYDEIAFPEVFSKPSTVEPLEPFRGWVEATFGVSIPTTGAEICPMRPCMNDEADEADPFWPFFDRHRG